MKKPLLLMFFISTINASELSINNSPGLDITGETSINCNGISINYSEVTQCCVGSACQDTSSVIFENSGNQCPKIVMDGYEYEVNSEIKIMHNVRLISVDSGSMTNCRRPDNSFPTTAPFGEINLSFNNVFAGIQIAKIDVDNWKLVMQSIDGNLTCQGGVFVDLIFNDDFE